MEFAYYPGCSLHSVAAEYEQTTRAVCQKLGVSLTEIPDWNCCGASSAHSVNHLAGIAVPARNLALAEEQGKDVVAPCAACYQRLVTADYEMREQPETRARVEKLIQRPWQGKVKVLSILDVFNQIGLEQIRKAAVKPLVGLKVACYYGCYLVKPPKIAHVDDPENPMLMDNILRTLGAETVDWPFKTECCGGSLVLTNTEVVLRLGKDILAAAEAAGANCLVTPCPLCQPNLDMRQSQINKHYNTSFNLPVFYLTELMALALGVSKSQIPLRKHFIDPQPLLVSF
ncbi:MULTISPECIES: CoB--CoM heterodisulfide reductase iron-sulfur subunit B family protein [unclassified Carboxydocella]|uniref:CoB--CoM heterodisulfide reductase iron-sulfur subunit B family protein n=1 Tax=unclassified Carboxydocella TaxID=2685367 RepID=UPI0009ABF31A|nr:MULTISPECIES: CoB--CoM heterodisulfide reductase iron-sulfur subunit B family protein [unclassified Carboxydocella]GAW30022.1 heterodisulfide reductase subunit B [Carboxydocella sp. ULO1]GAW32095.1 heterodisulfide reductase subunit B [Carboxydocella sp. JDF658]